jgi:flagellar biosynthesis chaperone FliJ
MNIMININNEENNNQLSEIIKYLDNLETRFKQLYDDLEKGELPVREKLVRTFTISESLRLSAIKLLRVGKKDLIKYYHECPQILTEYATEVDLIPDSYRSVIPETIFERSPRGKYWVILTENQTQKFYWLLPNGNQNNFRNFTNETISKIFEIESPNYATDNIILIEPAKLSICANDTQWKLEEKGFIKKGSIPPSSQTSFELEKISLLQEQLQFQITELKKQTDLILKLEKFNNSLGNFQAKIDNIDSQIREINQNINQISQSFNNNEQTNIIKFETLNQKLLNSQTKMDNLELTINQNFQQCSSLDKQIDIILQQQEKSKIAIANLTQSNKSQLKDFIDTYNHNPESLKDKVIIVSETQESIRQRSQEKSKNLIFEVNNNGVFLIISVENNHYLVLNYAQHLVIKAITIEKTLKLLFQCENYQEKDYSHPPILIKPAKVIPINDDFTQWQLQELGILKFKEN